MPKRLKIDKLKMLALAVAAYRHLDNKVVQFVEGKESNRQLVFEYFNEGKKFPGCDDPNLEEIAMDVRTTIQNAITMSLLTGATINDFTKNVNAILDRDILTGQDIGIVVWAPKVAANINKADSVKETIFEVGAGSQQIGSVGDKVTIDFTSITVRYLPDYHIWAHFGHDNKGNLISFMNKKQFNNGPITGKIKRYIKNQYTQNMNTTCLNYVKVAA